MQIENPETSLTPPTPSSPGRDAQSPEGIASLSSGSSDNALGKYKKKKISSAIAIWNIVIPTYFLLSWKSFLFLIHALSLNQIYPPTNQVEKIYD